MRTVTAGGDPIGGNYRLDNIGSRAMTRKPWAHR